MTPAELRAIERAMLPALLAHAATPEDHALIEEGIRVGMLPGFGDAIADFYDPTGARWRRFRAACARAEAKLHPEWAAYLTVRAHQADNEAAARERSLRRAA